MIPAVRTVLRRRRTLPLVLLALLLGLVGCTGTEEGGRPVLLVVAGDDRVGLVEDRGGADGAPRWLAEAEYAFPAGTRIVDTAVARDAGADGTEVHVHVLYRDAGGDAIRILDATAVPVEAPEAFAPVGDPLELDDLVGTMLAEQLCTSAFDVSQDGRWLALLHDPAACGAGDVPTTMLLVDLEAGPDEEVVDVLSGGDAMAPIFGASDEALHYLDLGLAFGPSIVSVPLPPDGREATLRLDDPIRPRDLGLGGAGRLVVAGEDAILGVDPDDAEARVARPSAPGLEAVVDARLLPAEAVVVRTAGWLVVHRDLTAEGEDEDPAEEPVPGIVDAVVGPDSFAYALSEGSLAVIDLLPYLARTSDRLTTTATADLPELGGAVAIEWVFGAFPEAEAERP